MALRATATNSTLFDTQRTIRLELENPGDEAIAVRSLLLDSPLFGSVDRVARSMEIPAQSTRLVPLPYGDSRCEATSEQAGVVEIETDAGVEPVELAVDPPGLLVGRHDRECAVAGVTDAADIAFGQDWVPAGQRAVQGGLTVSSRDGATRVRIVSVEGNVIFGITPLPEADPFLDLAPGDGPTALSVAVSADRCDTHALTESKRTFIYRIGVRLDEDDVVEIDVEPTGSAREVFEGLLQACLG